MKKRVFIDMDGVLCEYRAGDEVSDMERDGYFRELAPRAAMLKAVRYLIKSGLAEVYILSAVLPQKHDASITEKNDWLDTYLPEITEEHRIFTICGTNKADAVKEFCCDDILCDDYSANLFSWVKSGGKGIKVLNGVNGASGTYDRGPRLSFNGEEDLFLAVAGM